MLDNCFPWALVFPFIKKVPPPPPPPSCTVTNLIVDACIRALVPAYACLPACLTNTCGRTEAPKTAAPFARPSSATPEQCSYSGYLLYTRRVDYCCTRRIYQTHAHNTLAPPPLEIAFLLARPRSVGPIYVYIYI